MTLLSPAYGGRITKRQGDFGNPLPRNASAYDALSPRRFTRASGFSGANYGEAKCDLEQTAIIVN
jgi:hypothetical protein